ncbi:hypothetical protein IFM89_001138 [Coptis chinensis]|uniref:AAA+ ATPase domain-containing protein n=1 Tax=Coptis chinensis TaxID=261450 RepID=A0A835M443_9MAGN|nr:hypothetical protein IFM89_001138 [Coptis chinensis]
MGKRRKALVLLLSSSDEEEEEDFDALCDDFTKQQPLFAPPGLNNNKTTRELLWVDKYRPHSLLDLAVQNNKVIFSSLSLSCIISFPNSLLQVQQLKTWLKQRLLTPKEKLHGHVLLITGQAGVGKSATVHVIASHLGARLFEWNTPTPTLWQEHVYNLRSGLYYMSKLDEFESFVERIRKYPLLPLFSIGGSVEPSILLIDDLPLINGKLGLGRLRKCLHTLVGSTQIPTVILITEYAKSDSSNSATRDLEDIQSSLENAGACKMAFNPLTVNSIKKTLSKICREEQCNLEAEQIDQIARVSGGDIRNAITSLQYFCLTPGQLLSSNTNHPKDKAAELRMPNDGGALSFGREETLSLFHALGKFLHNKRESVNTVASGWGLMPFILGLLKWWVAVHRDGGVGVGSAGQNQYLLREKFARLPLKMDAPEKIICQANGEARLITDFLHENVLDFLSDEAVDNAWTVASYLCDADNLLANFQGSTWSRMTNNYELESIRQSAAASVAVRGVLFGNSHPAPSRWHAIRSPKIWQVEQSSRHNKNEIVRQRYEACNSVSYDLCVMATEYKPLLRWLKGGALKHPQTNQERMQDCQIDEDMLDCDRLDSSENDEIEDW